MVLWFITACYMVTPDGGQQGEDMDDTGLAGTDDTSLALDTGDSLLDSDGVDTRLGGIRLSVDDDRDGLEDRNCSGEIVLNEEGSGTAECVFESEGDPGGFVGGRHPEGDHRSSRNQAHRHLRSHQRGRGPHWNTPG